MTTKALMIKYEALESVKYDIIEQAKNIEVSIKLSDASNKLSSRYNRQDRLTALSVFVVTGSIRETGRICGMAASTVQQWSRTDWWASAIMQARTANDYLMDARCTKIINRTFDNIDDRLENGDYFVDKNHEMQRKPTSMKDNAVVMGITYDKRQINRALPTSIQQTTTTHLIDTKAQFDLIAQGRTIEHDTE